MLRDLVRDAGHRVARSEEKADDGDPVWEVRAWGGAFFALGRERDAAPGRLATLDDAVEAAGA